MIKLVAPDGKVISVTKGAKEAYLSLGYKVPNPEKKPLGKGKGSTKKTQKSEAELMLEKLEKKPIAKWTTDELKAYATEKNIDLKGTKSADEARKVISESMK